MMASKVQQPESSPPKAHGVISQYDQKLMMRKQGPVPETEGDFPYNRGDEFPVLQPPRPTAGSILSDITDPSLCLSPDHKLPPSLSQNQRTKKRENFKEGDNELRVRFDRSVRYNDALSSHGDQPDLVPTTQNPDYYRSNLADHYSSVLESVKPAAAYPQLPTSCLSPQPRPQFTDDRTESHDGPISVMASDMNDLDLSVIDTGDHASSDHPLARREINSSLFLAKELQKLEAEKPDLIRQVENKLQTSQKTKSRVEEKVYAKLNYKEKFESIASINVTEEELERRRGDVERTKRIQKPPCSVKQEVVTPPDIMEFFTPDLQKEWSSYSVYTPQYPVGPGPAPQESAFTLYRHIRSWETS